MRLLHTSDWHLGQNFFSTSRTAEAGEFLEWLIDLIRAEHIDVLIVAGDIFDTQVPSNAAQKQYFDFLYRVKMETPCEHIVIIGGNHDSPSLLNAPKDILKIANVHIFGSAETDPTHEVLLLKDGNGNPLCVVGAVPFLRDREVRKSVLGESDDSKADALKNGIKRHYQVVAQEMNLLKNSNRVPAVMTGHLHVAGTKLHEGDGVREPYIGNLLRVGTEIFTDVADYVALGHIHKPQSAGGQEHIRYSGSPYPMSFDDTKQPKSVVIVDLEYSKPATFQLVPIPTFVELVRLEGDLEYLRTQLSELSKTGKKYLIDILYTGAETHSNLREALTGKIDCKLLQILKIRDNAKRARLIQSSHSGESLDELTPEDVFDRILTSKGFEESKQIPLKILFQELLHRYQSPEEAVNSAETSLRN